jgi:hypothetical protein
MPSVHRTGDRMSTWKSRVADPRLIGSTIVVLALIVPAWLIAIGQSSTTGDIALIELRTRDVFSLHPPTVGAYSRYGWSHPGPAQFYIFALPYYLFGSSAIAFRVTALLFNASVLAVIAWMLSRRGTPALVAGLAATTLLVWGMVPLAMADGWNVTVAMLPFGLTIVAAWCALCGDRWSLSIAWASYLFVVQAHIGFGIVLTPLMAVTTGYLVLIAARTSTFPWRRLQLGVLAVIVAFGPVLFDVAVNWPGNLGRLAKWSVTNTEPSVGFGDALRLIGRTSSLSFPISPQVPGSFLLAVGVVQTGLLPGIAIVGLIIASIACVRYGWSQLAWLCSIILAGWVAAVIAAASIARPLFTWLVDWLQPLGWLTWAALALVMIRGIQHRLDDSTSTVLTGSTVRRMAAVLAVIVLCIGAIDSVSENRAEADRSADVTTHQLADSVDRAVSTGTISLRYEGTALNIGSMMAGIANDLIGRGRVICVDREFANRYGDHRVCPSDTTSPLAANDSSITDILIRGELTAAAPPTGGVMIGLVDPLTPEQRRDADDLTARLTEVLMTNGLDDQVHLLYTSLIGLVLTDNPPPAVAAVTPQIRRLETLRMTQATRYALYLMQP